jgi:peptide/nickel transport system substrate-binding protein
VQYAIDRTATQTAAGGAQAAEIATNLAPPVVIGRQRFDAYPTDLAKAKTELTACGKPSGFTTKIAIRQGRPKDTAMAEAVQRSLAQAGITVTLQQYPVTGFYSDYAGKPSYVHAHDLGMILSVWGPDYPTAMGFFPLLVDGRRILPTGNTNLSELNDAGVNEILDRLAETKDQTTREGLAADLDRKVMETGAMVPLLFDKMVLYRGTRLTNAAVSQMYVGYDLATIGLS